MSRKLALSAFCASNGAFEATSRKIAAHTLRTFSSTAQRNKEMVYFTKSSSPELDKILNEIRQKIILPAYLPKDQQKKIYAKKYEKLLQADPITIEIDGEVNKFRYQDPFVSIPSTSKSLYSAISLFTPEDFSNLRPLIEGLTIAGRNLDSGIQAKIIRKAGHKGRIYDIIELARGVRRTNFKLDSAEKITELLHWVQMKAVDSAWDPEETAKALRWAEIVVDLVEEEDHRPGAAKDSMLLAQDPTTSLATLHLAAALALKQGTEADPALIDKVTRHAKKIVLLWEEGLALLETKEPVLLLRDGMFAHLREKNIFVKFAAPWLYGLDSAIKVLQDRGGEHSELATKLQVRRDSLAAEIQAARQGLQRGRMGEAVWKAVFEGERGDWSKQENKNEVEA
ncbi:hypothetical protein F4805DRAFT_166654 [Annulohypoxylon moriforme]|nr:hypothetical protein F4805DRAFT_166654 [Annulohypoxylon moriforme]